MLARRHGLRWYNADAHTWEHRDRALLAGNPAAARFESLSPAERTALPVAERVAMSLHVERGPMIVDDLRQLPTSPLIVAEGTSVTPNMLPPGSNAVWLLPSYEVQRARLAERHHPNSAPELYLHMWRVIAAEVRDADATLVVDDLTVNETVAAVERHFADSLSKGPNAETIDERRQLLRYANRAIVNQHEAGFARPWATGDVRTAIRTFDCECAQPDCEATVDLPIAAFPPPPDTTSPPLLAPGHRAEGS
ncbi:hypothetical protein MOQ72_16455 [Saccharopolyspora sp. K220]|uniref:hypothetical protein n=1 Tax=Saccharopolyspora soli TaxID=2926618 RepID=UPI001F5A7A5E|nr:hypothetical protein [Saccharopolyspora soli]MCI2419037.1 hypothetical protein [Saccharopolyspora soli]